MTASGQMDCDEAECAFEITEETTETFSALPYEGYRFVRWKGVCGREPTNTCTTTVAPLPETLSEFDGEVTMRAVFERTDRKRTWYRDRDGDNFGAANESLRSAARPDGFVVNKKDCDDNDATIFPWNKELPDQLDNNCNGRIDEGFVEVLFWQDADGDGFGDPDASLKQLEQPEGYVRNKLDCDDDDANEHPDAGERMDGIDNDCDGDIDEGSVTYYRDVDGDGYGSASDTVTALEALPGYVDNDDDCDDNNADVSPRAEERDDSVDNNCNGEVDEGFFDRTYYRDQDGDGYGDPAETAVAREAPAGFVSNGTDNCVEIANASQSDLDGDGIGDACDEFTDSDDDGHQDSVDNCPLDYNPGQDNADGDAWGDACDDFTDSDNDGHEDSRDNCPLDYNPSQANSDGDAWGDACDDSNDSDRDGDGFDNDSDNCPDTSNPSQDDSDGDGIGDACDPVHDSPTDGDCPMSSEDRAMLLAVNAARATARNCGSRGDFAAAPPVTWNCALEAAALGHSMDMARNGFFSHTGSDGQSAGTRATRAGYVWSALAENIAAGGAYSAPAAVVQGWLDSDGHCANIMGGNYSNIGAAKYSDPGSTYGVYWTQMFGRPW